MHAQQAIFSNPPTTIKTVIELGLVNKKSQSCYTQQPAVSFLRTVLYYFSKIQINQVGSFSNFCLSLQSFAQLQLVKKQYESEGTGRMCAVVMLAMVISKSVTCNPLKKCNLPLGYTSAGALGLHFSSCFKLSMFQAIHVSSYPCFKLSMLHAIHAQSLGC